MIDEIQGKVIEAIKDAKDKGIAVPIKIKEDSLYSKIPTNLGEINGYTLANYLAYWTAMTSWSGYNLASLKAKVEYLKRYIARNKKEIYLTLENQGTIKDKEAMTDTHSTIIPLEIELDDLLLKTSMMDYIYDANMRTLSLFSREISRRSSSYREDFSQPDSRSLPTEESY